MQKRTKIALWVFLASMILAFSWNSLPLIKNTIHTILDPTAGKLLNFNINLGILVVAFAISLIISLIQKFTIDQESFRKMKAEQKLLQEEMKKFKDHPEKLMELQKKQFEFIPKTFDITLGPLIYTAIPIVLFFRWFSDYFTSLPTPEKIFGVFSTHGTFLFPSWLWAYLLASILFSSIFRKWLKLA